MLSQDARRATTTLCSCGYDACRAGEQVDPQSGRRVPRGRFIRALQVEPRAPVDLERTEPGSLSKAMAHAEEDNRRGLGFPYFGRDLPAQLCHRQR